MRKCCFSDLNVFNSDAPSNSNFDSIISWGHNWLSASEGDVPTDSDISTDLSVKGGSVLLLIAKEHLQLQVAGHSQLCHFLKRTVHQAYQKFFIEKFIM